MIINDREKTDSIFSEEGSTQGAVNAMAMYAIGIRPLINALDEKTDSSKCQQVWYADDSSTAGHLCEIRKWWGILNQLGPKYGYYPNASKTILIVKNEELCMLANQIFDGTGIKITLTGERHLGAVIGSPEFRSEYVRNKVHKWIDDVKQLALIAKEEPQAAYSAYTKALSMRWCFVQRTIPDTKDYFIPLEEVIREELIPAIIGRTVTDIERKILSLPVRMGGMGIQNPVLTADIEFENSINITRNLTALIEQQETDLRNYDTENLKDEIAKMKTEKEKKLMAQLDDVKQSVDNKLKRSLELAGEKGAGAWLSALPLHSLGYDLNKQEFRDGICLRYSWRIPNTPSFCGCGDKNSIDHTLNCKLGGYVHMRHNNIRDLEAALLKNICKDVKVEPELLPLGNSGTESTNDAEKARLDVSAIGIWSSMERTFLDIRVMHPNSASYMDTTPEQLYCQHEREKKRTYNDRIL